MFVEVQWSSFSLVTVPGIPEIKSYALIVSPGHTESLILDPTYIWSLISFVPRKKARANMSLLVDVGIGV